MQVNQPTFKGISISKVADKNMKIYSLTQKDVDYVNILRERLDIQKLMPNLSKDELELYKFMINRGLYYATFKQKNSMLLAYNNQPCGFIVSSENGLRHNIDYLCTWAAEENGKKAPLGGQTLLLKMFENFLDSGAKSIELNAVRIGNAFGKYIKLGFLPCGGTGVFETMRISKAKVEDVVKNLKDKIALISTDNMDDIDLSKELILK